MPNNFRLTGNYYVSKFGNDAWSGTSPDAPKRTIQAALTAMTTGSIVIGSGYYQESLSKTHFTLNGTINLLADGNVVLVGTPTSTIYILAQVQGGRVEANGITFLGYAYVALTALGSQGAGTTVTNCKYINTSIYNYDGNPNVVNSFSNCTFINVSYLNTPLGNDQLSFNYCVFINFTKPSRINTLTNCYADSSTTLTTLSTIAPVSFNYNNIQGAILMGVASSVTSGVIQDTLGRYYDLSLAGNGGSGSLAEPYKRGDTLAKPFNFANHRIAYPTMNTSSSAVDPKFNSIEDQDFTLQAGSWHIGRASDGISNIGGTKYSIRRTSKSNTFSGSSVTVDPSLIFQYDNYIISGSQVTGSITSAPIAVNTSVPKVIQKVTYNGLLAFNKDTGSASGSNQNVPDFDTFTSASGNAAANPDRLVYYMRHTTGSSIPVTDAGWENGGLWTAGQYNVFEWNTKPSIDNNGVGNGSGSFNAAVTPTFIQATYVQMQVKLRNDYLL